MCARDLWVSRKAPHYIRSRNYFQPIHVAHFKVSSLHLLRNGHNNIHSIKEVSNNTILQKCLKASRTKQNNYINPFIFCHY